jgi:hypothetical protein
VEKTSTGQGNEDAGRAKSCRERVWEGRGETDEFEVTSFEGRFL